MHARRFACLLLGMWLAGSALMTWIAADSFDAAPRMLAARGANPGARLQSLAREDVRMLLAFPVRQAERWLEQWGDLEIALGAFFFAYLLLGTREGKVTLGLSLIPLAVAVFERVFVTPRLLYFEGMRLGLILVEALQLASGAVVAVLLIGRRHGRSGLTREEVDAIDKADHRHVNR